MTEWGLLGGLKGSEGARRGAGVCKKGSEEYIGGCFRDTI